MVDAERRAEIAMRTCTQCGITKPLNRAFAKFDKKRPSRRKVCRACRNRSQRVQRKARGKYRAVQVAAQRVLDMKRDVKRVTALVSKLVNHMGGIDGLAAEWIAAMSAAKDAGRHHINGRLLSATMDLMIVANQLQQKPPKIPDLSRLSDRQLEELEAVLRSTSH